jgi:hypothetical protein
MAQAGDQADLDRIRADAEHDWNRRGRGLCRQRRLSAARGHDHRYPPGSRPLSP